MKRTIFSILMTFAISSIMAQVAKRPTDYLLPEFHKARRQALREKMPDNSVAVFFSNPVRNRANDVQFVYHQDPDFHYLTGLREPHSVLLIFKESRSIDGVSTNETIFVRAHDALKELYDGARLGEEGAISELLLTQAFEGPDFENFNLDFSAFDKVMFYDFFDDVRDTKEKGDLYDLIKQFKQKVGYKSSDLSIEPKSNNIDLVTLNKLMTKLRGIKEKEELTLLRKAVNISTIGQKEVMKAMRPGMSETEIQGMHEYIYKKYQAEYEGYPSIVGAGHNGCVLHYIDNYKPKIEDGEMILMDLGAEYHGYTADVTRTIPVNGKFSKEQKIIYDLVYEAQEAAMAISKPGVKFSKLNEVINDIIVNNLAELGIYQSNQDKDVINPDTGRKRYNPHGCCHHIGLDVHDKGEYDQLKENMVITIEPGIYIPEGSPCDEKWWNIAVRIEDDFLITKDGYELLSNLAPRTSDEIEKLMAEPSPFDKVVLPDID
jgi:Xaa-Pro aminopeptidase